MALLAISWLELRKLCEPDRRSGIFDQVVVNEGEGLPASMEAGGFKGDGQLQR